MSIYSADLPQVHAVSFLWALPALPALAALELALAGRVVVRRFGARAAGAAAVALTGLACGGALAAAVLLLPIGVTGPHVLVEARGALVAAGALQIAATASLGSFSASLALVGAFATCAAAVAVAARGDDDPSGPLAAVCGVGAGALAVVVADDLVLALVGWEIAIVSTVALVRRAPGASPSSGAEAYVTSRVGQGAWLAGAALLCWGLGARGGDASGRMTVTADVGGTSGAAMELRTLGERPPAVSVRPVLVGPTFVAREIADQLALRDDQTHRPFADVLAARRLGPVPLAPVAFALLLLGALGAMRLAVAAPIVASAALAARVGGALGHPGAIGAWAVGALVLVAGGARVPRRALRELGVLPARDLGAAAAWLERRALAPAAPVLAFVALGLTVLLLAR